MMTPEMKEKMNEQVFEKAWNHEIEAGKDPKEAAKNIFIETLNSQSKLMESEVGKMKILFQNQIDGMTLATLKSLKKIEDHYRKGGRFMSQQKYEKMCREIKALESR